MLTLNQGHFSVLYSACGQMHKEPGGSVTKEAAVQWTKRCSIPQDIMTGMLTGGSWPGRANHCWQMG